MQILHAFATPLCLLAAFAAAVSPLGLSLKRAGPCGQELCYCEFKPPVNAATACCLRAHSEHSTQTSSASNARWASSRTFECGYENAVERDAFQVSITSGIQLDQASLAWAMETARPCPCFELNLLPRPLSLEIPTPPPRC